jgi:sugar lactone lactonase YvrE
MPPSTEASVFVAPSAEEDRFLPEGPREVAVEGRPAVAWVNIQTAPDAANGAIHLRFWDTGELHTVPVPGRPGFWLPTDRPNVVLVGATKALGRLDLVSQKWELVAAIPDDNPRTFINDAEIVPGGEAVVFGTKDVKFADPIGELYLFTVADRRLTKLAGGQTCSNGKVFARTDGGLTLFDIDTPRKAINRYQLDVAGRSLTGERVAVDLRSVPAFPDGMCDVGDGTVVVAFYNPDPLPFGRASRYRLNTGELVEEWQTPGSPRVTCPLLVRRPEGVKLIFTTATEGMPADQRVSCPNAGCLFVVDTSFASLPASEMVRLS